MDALKPLEAGASFLQAEAFNHQDGNQALSLRVP
jgi:hypothetical protein